LQRKKVGLALGGGGARGLAHIGVLQILEEEDIPIDMIAGASAGAAIGALYAQGKDASLIKNLAIKLLDWRKLLSLVDFGFSRTGLIHGKKVWELLKLIMGGDVNFSDLKIQLACVATDITRCEEVVINEGSVVDAVRASFSIPGIFAVAKLKGRYLVDGSLVNPVPVSVVRRMGADFVIAVNVIPDFKEKRFQTDKEGIATFKKPNIFNVVTQSFQMAQCLLVRSCLESADIVIRPRVAHIGVGDFRRRQECILQGELATKDSIIEINRQLGIRKAKGD
jgi:NTE family protein